MGEPGSTTAQLERCLRLLRAGEAQARNDLMNFACERLRRLTRKMLQGFPNLRGREETDDVLQNSLMRLCRALEKVHPESVRHFYNLAAVQIRRELIDLTRHHFGPQGQGTRHQQVDDEPLDPAGGPASLEEWTDFHEKVDKLPDDERETFNLLWYEGLTQNEAAAIVGVTVRTIKARWRSARYTLFNELKGQPPRG